MPLCASPGKGDQNPSRREEAGQAATGSTAGVGAGSPRLLLPGAQERKEQTVWDRNARILKGLRERWVGLKLQMSDDDEVVGMLLKMKKSCQRESRRPVRAWQLPWASQDAFTELAARLFGAVVQGPRQGPGTSQSSTRGLAGAHTKTPW